MSRPDDAMTHDGRSSLQINKGVCYALYAYDVGMSIDLEKCKSLITSGALNAGIRPHRRAPKYFDYRPTPLLVTQVITSRAISGYKTSGDVDLLLYDFGGVSVSYEIPFSGSLDTLRSISGELSESSALLDDSRARVENLLKATGGAVMRPHIADLVEDYAVFQIDDYHTAWSPEELYAKCAQDLAQILRAEHAVLSSQEVADAMACRISFSTDDVTMIDWASALIFDRDADDVRAVLEFANMELLEMRFLDHQLDDALDQSYEMIGKNTLLRNLLPGLAGASMRRISQMQVDGAILFERVSNAPKLLGDQYLARVYRLASQRFHLNEWNASILRKLDAIEGIYKQMHDRAASRRLEALEWIIVVLILLELVVPFLPKSWFRM
jgi:hypothetical protein